MTDKDQLVFCTYCGRGFRRKEHLERHYASKRKSTLSLGESDADAHTDENERRNKCQWCGVGFNRQDELQKHYRKHNRDKYGDRLDGTPEATRPRQPQRVPCACHHCHASHMKCDKELPCKNCQNRGITCVRRPSGRKPSRRSSENYGMEHSGGITPELTPDPQTPVPWAYHQPSPQYSSGEPSPPAQYMQGEALLQQAYAQPSPYTHQAQLFPQTFVGMPVHAQHRFEQHCALGDLRAVGDVYSAPHATNWSAMFPGPVNENNHLSGSSFPGDGFPLDPALANQSNHMAASGPFDAYPPAGFTPAVEEMPYPDFGLGFDNDVTQTVYDMTPQSFHTGPYYQQVVYS